MDWRILFTTFVTVFFAELGDKTQLTTLGLATGAQGGKLAVFLGSALALIATSALAVAGGDLVARYISPALLRRIAGVAFIVLGVVHLLPSKQ